MNLLQLKLNKLAKTKFNFTPKKNKKQIQIKLNNMIKSAKNML